MMITQSWQHAAAMRPGLAQRLRDRAVAATALLLTWRERQRQRALLNGLDDRMLRDIGLTPDTCTREATKPFWRA